MVSRLLMPHAPLCPEVLSQPTKRVGLVESRQNKNSCSPGAVVPSARLLVLHGVAYPPRTAHVTRLAGPSEAAADPPGAVMDT